MKLYFQSSSGKERFIADVLDSEEAMKKVRKFCSERDFKIHYTRMWKRDDGATMIDVSSHTEFFIIYE